MCSAHENPDQNDGAREGAGNRRWSWPGPARVHECRFLTSPPRGAGPGRSQLPALSVCLPASRPAPLPEAVPKSVRLMGYLVLLLYSYTTERRLAQPDNVDVFVLTVPEAIQCKPASSLIAARCLGCCPFVRYILCRCTCTCECNSKPALQAESMGTCRPRSADAHASGVCLADAERMCVPL